VTHSTFSTNLRQINYPGYRQTDFFEGGNSQEKFLAVLPFFHMYGLQIVMANTLYTGAHTLCIPKFEPSSFIKAVKSKVSHNKK
jgi:acyl-CoA synthetase (AMP-forming)/AMP-acid ligase II